MANQVARTVRTPQQRLRDGARSLGKKIEAKRNPTMARQNLTARRARIVAGMAREADRLEAAQRCMLWLADLHETGRIAPTLAKLRGQRDIGLLAHYGPRGSLPVALSVPLREDRLRLEGLGLGSDQALRRAWKLLGPVFEAEAAPDPEREWKERERALLGRKIPGFFPTPDDLADRLCKEAGIKPGDHVLEPSGGKGDLVEAALRAGASGVVTVETNYELCELMEVRFTGRQVKVHCDDFLQANSKHSAKFDAVVMNPPFERYADRLHVLAAMKHLRPGGWLASIMGVGAVSMRGYEGFLDELALLTDGAYSWTDLPEGSFRGAGSFHQTGVRAVLLTARRRADTP